MIDATVIANLIAATALIVSVVALIRARRADRVTQDLQRKQATLADHQIREHERETTAGFKADIRCEIVDIDRATRKLMVRNHGPAAASQVTLAIAPLDGRPSPVPQDQIRDRFPVPKLAPGSECSVHMSKTFGTSGRLRADWTWQNADGTLEKRTTTLWL